MALVRDMYKTKAPKSRKRLRTRKAAMMGAKV